MTGLARSDVVAEFMYSRLHRVQTRASFEKIHVVFESGSVSRLRNQEVVALRRETSVVQDLDRSRWLFSLPISLLGHRPSAVLSILSSEETV